VPSVYSPFCLSVCFAAAVAEAQTAATPDLLSLSLEDLLKVEIVSSASKFPPGGQGGPGVDHRGHRE
jgi:hypothetical protein